MIPRRLSALAATLLLLAATAPRGHTADLVVHSQPATGSPTVVAATTVKTANANTGMPGVFTLTLPAPVTAKLKVKYLLGGTAANGTDYRALNGKAVFKLGQSSVEVQVVPTAPPVGVLFDAFKKTVTLTLQPGPGYKVGTTDKPAKVKIVRTSGIILP